MERVVLLAESFVLFLQRDQSLLVQLVLISYDVDFVLDFLVSLSSLGEVCNKSLYKSATLNIYIVG